MPALKITKLLNELNRYFPFAGPCAFCGNWDKRHRLFDVIYGRYNGGESVKSLAKDYETTPRAIKLVLMYEGTEVAIASY